ncbi:hypothetical protein [Ollibium composti]|uniref:Uncharacterized protein n=1 Tax=Ollibium composti TaxID=2675109 RepID=A0ABY2Q7Y9_9HYPH|nr:hypothetical protein [Mesorhizobium composti]THF57727.1 hypothetical protein E6C48_08225 [Mesorhizobium composti]
MQQFNQFWVARRRALLSGAAFAGVLLAGVAGQPALAACTFSDANTFSCGSMVTGPADVMINATSEATTGTIEAGATISGLGLGIVAGPGGSLNIINNGAVTGSIIGLTIGSVAGNITYSGNGSASGGLAAAGLSIFAGPGTIAVGTADTPVIPNFSGFAGLATVSSTATSIFLNGGSLSSLGAYGLQMQGGDVSAKLTGVRPSRMPARQGPAMAFFRRPSPVRRASHRTRISVVPEALSLTASCLRETTV